MRKILLVTIAAALLSSTAQAQQVPTEAQIEAAVKDVKTKTFSSVQIRAGQYILVISGPLTRVARAAEAAAKELRPFKRADVTDEMIGPYVRVAVWPADPADASSVPPPVTNVIVRPLGVTDLAMAVQPIKKETFPQSWGNALGAKFESEGMIADFSLGDVPAGSFSIVIGCDCRRGQPMATVSAKDRAKIR